MTDGQRPYSIHHDDSRQMAEIDDASVNLVVTSPPYNVGKDYDAYDDSLSLDTYKTLLRDVFTECYRILRDDGRIAVNVAMVVGRPLLNLPTVIDTILSDIGFHLRDHFIWDKGESESSSAWGSWKSASNPYEIFTHEHILVAYKNDPGRNDTGTDTMTKETFMRNIKSVWNIKPTTETDHPAPFPVELPRRLIELYTYENDTVVDPFMGSGTTGVAALDTNRQFIGYEISEDYCEMAYRRLDPNHKIEAGLDW